MEEEQEEEEEVPEGMHCSPPTTTAPLTPNTPNGDYDDDSCEYGVPTPHILSILIIFVKGVCG